MRARGPAGELMWLLALSGCGSSLAPDPTVVPLASWGTAYAAVICAKIFGCCDTAERMYWGYADEAQCRQTVAQQQGDLGPAVTMGLIVYDGKAARRCLDEINATSCAEQFNHPNPQLVSPSCADVTRGAGKLGAVCEDLDFICESSYCDTSTGTCGPPGGCPAGCAAGQYCDGTTNVCVAAKPEGAACETSRECGPPLTCQINVCGPPLPDGGACLSNDYCLSGSCVGAGQGTGTGAGACGAPLPDGSPCGSDSGCASGTCITRASGGFPTCGPPFCDGA